MGRSDYAAACDLRAIPAWAGVAGVAQVGREGERARSVRLGAASSFLLQGARGDVHSPGYERL